MRVQEHGENSVKGENVEQRESRDDTYTFEDEIAATVVLDSLPRRRGIARITDKYTRRYVSIRWKVGGAFALVLLLTVIMGIVSVVRLFSVQTQVNTLTNTNLQVVEQSNALKEELYQMESSMRGYLITGNTELLSTGYDPIKTEYQSTFSVLQKLLSGNEADEHALKTAENGFEAYLKYADSLINQRDIGQGNQAIEQESAGQGDNAEQAATSGLDSIIQKYQQQASLSAHSLQRDVDITLVVMAILCAIAIAAGLGAGIPVTLSTPKNIDKVTQMLREIASAGGDLTKRIEGVKSRDEVARLAEATNALLESIANLVRQIGRHSDTLAASAQQLTASTDETARAVNDVAATAGDFAQVSEQSVGALNELTSSLQTIQEHSDETSARADNVAAAVNNVSETTERGKNLVTEAEGSMESMQKMTERAHASVKDLNDSSAEIAQILKTIRDIADETNLLALNASIEAARAGDAGRGFAVVAQEVRHLAEQSRASTSRINEIVGRNLELMVQVSSTMEEGVVAVKNGRQAFNRTRQAFQEIHDAVQEVVPSTVDIVERALTQAQLIHRGQGHVERLNQLIQQVAAGSENNAASSEETLATVEEIAASAHELAKIAQSLQDAVGQFQV